MIISMCNWDKNKKPSADTCPQGFCFLWHDDVSKCGEVFGPCRRLTKDMNDHDLYEPNEPELAKHGLPWFYFIAGSYSVVKELKKKYIQETKELWGDNS